MKTILVLLAFAGSAAAYIEWTELRERYGYYAPFSAPGYYELPINVSAAQADNWVMVDGISSFNINCYCMADDPRYCLFYDQSGTVVGFQIGLLDDDLARSSILYNMSDIPAFTLKTMFGMEVWTAEAYISDPDVLEADGRTNASSIDETKAVWIKNGDSYMEISRNETDMAASTNFVKENCINKIGLHYFYNMSESLDCRTLNPWGVLYNNESELLGLTFIWIGYTSSLNREWDEALTYEVITNAIPNRPDCLVDTAKEYGLISTHTFFVKEPWNFTC